MDNITLKKHNSVTDAKTDYSLTAEKLLNAVYHTWQEKGVEKFDVSIVDLKELIGMTSDGKNELVYDALKELQTLQQFRNFDYKGRQVKYHSGMFLSSVTVWKDNQNYATIRIDEIIIEALKQQAGYTPIDLAIVEKFKTKYSYKIYQMWRRYFWMAHKNEFLGTFKLTLDELNEKLSTDFKFFSKAEEAVKRGVLEINALMKKLDKEERIYFTLPDKEKGKERYFDFYWTKLPSYLQTEAIFVEYMRKNYIGQSVIRIQEGQVAINKNGLLYFNDETKNYPELNAKLAQKVWGKMYELAQQNKLICLKQQKLEGMD